MQLLTGVELAMIQRDLMTLMNGPDGCDCVLKWSVKIGPEDPVYKDTPTYTEHTLDIRVHVNRIFKQTEIEKKKMAEVVSGDAIFLIGTDVVIQDLYNVRFEIDGLGTWALVRDVPPAISAYCPMYIQAGGLIQYVFVRRIQN